MKKIDKSKKKKIIIQNKDEVDIEKKKVEEYEDLIDKDYLQFLDEQIKYDIWTPCQTTAFLKKYKNKEYKYPDSSTNIQLSTYVKNIKKNKINQWTRLYLLLITFVSNEYAGKILNFIKKNPTLSDRNLIKLIENAHIKDKLPGKFNDNSKEECSENVYEFQNIYLNFKQIYDKIHNKRFNINTIKKTEFKYLDIGCGNGKKTQLLSKIFKIPLSQTYGTDIIEWGPYKNTQERKFNFHFKNIKEDGRLDFPDNYFDLVSCFFTLHHIPYLSQILKEIKRVLKPNGLLLIIEHFIIDKQDALLIDIQHMLYSYIYDKQKVRDKYKNYIQNPPLNRYFNVVEWDYIFIKKFGFQYKKANILYSSPSYIQSYDNQYYAMYENIK